MDFKVSIIGGGIGGLSFANALHAEGMDFDLFEQAPELTEIGAAVSISKVPLDILQTFGLAQQLKDAGFVTRYSNITDKNLNIVRGISLEWPVVIIHRAKLIGILSSLLPVNRIHLGKKLVDIQSETESAILHFADGSAIQSGCSVIADGINSTVRNKILPEIKVRYSGQTIWRGITKMQLPSKYANAYFEMWGNTKRFLFVPMDEENVFWLAVKKAPVGEQDNPATVRDALLHEFSDFHPLTKDLLSNTSNVIRSDLADLGNQFRPWHHNRIAFLGDSIHATTPNLGQGACQAIEDAYCLTQLMKNGEYKDLPTMFKTYQRLRNPKVSFIVNQSWLMGKMAHNPLTSQIGKLILRFAPNRLLRSNEAKINDDKYLQRKN